MENINKLFIKFSKRAEKVDHKTEETFSAGTQTKSQEGGLKVGASSDGLTVESTSKVAHQTQEQSTHRQKSSGDRIHRVNFGRIADVFRRLIKALNNLRLWIILDEWSVIPLDLQPYLADLIRRSLCPWIQYANQVKLGIRGIKKLLFLQHSCTRSSSLDNR
jgi:hypothetical protein